MVSSIDVAMVSQRPRGVAPSGETSPMFSENGVSPGRTCLNDVPIAIVGMGCRFPGEATSPEKLWQLCSNTKSAWSEIPPGRWNKEAFYHPDGGKTGTVNSNPV